MRDCPEVREETPRKPGERELKRMKLDGKITHAVHKSNVKYIIEQIEQNENSEKIDVGNRVICRCTKEVKINQDQKCIYCLVWLIRILVEFKDC